MTLLAQNAKALLNARMDSVAEYIIENTEIEIRATIRSNCLHNSDIISNYFIAHRIYFDLRTRFDKETTLYYIKEYYNRCYEPIKAMSDLIEYQKN